MILLNTLDRFVVQFLGSIQISASPAGGSAQTVVSGVTYHPFGGAKAFTFGNAQTYSRTYDLDGRISGFTLAGTAMTVGFDAASRITGATYFPVPAQSLTYGYDNLDRLTSAVMPTTSQSFGYDFNGNRTSKTVGASTQSYAYPTTNNKLSSITGGGTQTYTHDANGAVTNDGTNTFTYDTRGRLVGAATALGAVTYQVNSLGQRYQKTLQGTTTVYLYDQSGRLIAETADAGQTYTQYVWLAGTPVAVIKPTTPNPTLYFIHNDHLDTPRVLTNQTQQVVWRWDNDDPFGANVANENPSGLGTFVFNLRLPGQYFDKETNLHYNNFRDYSPELGRYLESDPIGLSGGLNTYSYALSDPLFWVDPTGLLTRPVDPGPVRGPDLGAREGGACGVRRTRNGKNYSHAGVDLLHGAGGNVVAPISGTASISGSEGVLICQQVGTACCGNTTKPKLICYRLVHISPTATRGTVKEGQVVGTVAPQSNPNVPSHVHVEYYEVGCDPDKPNRSCPPFQ